MTRQIAAFDFDGTLTHRDTMMPFLLQAFGRRRVTAALARVAPSAGRARYVSARGTAIIHHRDVTKERFLRELFTGGDPVRVAEQGEHYAQSLARQLRPEMVEKVQWHRAAGHELIIVSASLLAYLQPFTAQQGFDHVIAVGLEVGADGRLTGGITGPNVRGPEKAVRLREWLAGDAVGELWAYGNSSGDNELLGMASRPVWVSRRAPGGVPS